MARPRKQIDEKKVEQLAAIGCSEKEIGVLVGCSDDLLERRFAGALKRGRARRNQNLRKLQYEAAKDGNVTMQIWLGKQWLGQKDKPVEETNDVLTALLIQFQAQYARNEELCEGDAQPGLSGTDH